VIFRIIVISVSFPLLNIKQKLIIRIFSLTFDFTEYVSMKISISIPIRRSSLRVEVCECAFRCSCNSTKKYTESEDQNVCVDRKLQS